MINKKNMCFLIVILYLISRRKEQFEDTIGVIRNRISKDTQFIGQIIKDKLNKCYTEN